MRVKIGLWFLWCVFSPFCCPVLQKDFSRNSEAAQICSSKAELRQPARSKSQSSIFASASKRQEAWTNCTWRCRALFCSGDETVVCACVDWDALMLEETSGDRNGGWTTVSGKFWTLWGAMEKMKRGQLCVVIRMMSPHGSLSQNTNFILNFL